MAQTTHKKRSSKARAKRPATFRSRLRESDGQYLLKLAVVIIFGTLWIKFGHVFYLGQVAVTGVPLGMLAGMLLVDKFEVHQDDRKIWYALLVIVALVSYFLPMGIVI
jgi:hypothetical protein